MEISGFFCHSEFYVKSVSENTKVLKLLFLVILGDLNLVELININLQKVQTCIKKYQISNPVNVQMADFALLDSTKLISRKI